MGAHRTPGTTTGPQGGQHLVDRVAYHYDRFVLLYGGTWTEPGFKEVYGDAAEWLPLDLHLMHCCAVANVNDSTTGSMDAREVGEQAFMAVARAVIVLAYNGATDHGTVEPAVLKGEDLLEA